LSSVSLQLEPVINSEETPTKTLKSKKPVKNAPFNTSAPRNDMLVSDSEEKF